MEEAFLKVDRKNYVASSATSSAYQDAPQAIGGGQTISAPHMHAHATEEMMPTLAKFSREEKELNILDVVSLRNKLVVRIERRQIFDLDSTLS